MVEAAKVGVDLGASIIDINMGCPAKTVTGRQSGSALIRQKSALIRAKASADLGGSVWLMREA